MFRLFVISLLGLLVAPSRMLSANESGQVDFARDVRPLLSENCFFCHGPDGEQRQADLRLDTEAGLSAVIIPGDRQQSPLVQRLISHDADEVMPPPDANRRLSAEQIEVIGRWVDQGAAWQTHWAFRPLVAPPLPAAAANPPAAPQHNPIDRFVQAGLVGSGLAPSPPAARHELIRRLTLDLTGLPPTPEEVTAFQRDADPQAYLRLVERLLASPQLGQRMAWDWLDAARYADTNGYQGDNERTMWPWRDWVVRAINDNLPFDQFTVWQLAGDLLPAATPEQILASGFLRNHMINGEGGRIAEENRVEYVFDMAETTSTVWLGLTMNCCRCHDHKYDPLTQQDYYRWFAFFNQTPVTGRGGDPQTPPNLSWPSAAQRSQQESLRDEMHRLRERQAEVAATVCERPPRPRTPQTAATPPTAVTTLPEYRQLASRATALEKRLASLEQQIPKVMVMADLPSPRETHVLERGLYNKPTTAVTAGTPAFLPNAPTAQADATASRLDMAQWLVAADNPLTPRVTVNRVWQQFFGVGLVKTTEDFGAQGEVPKHEPLLNWLAADFRDSGWDLKHLIRTIVTSHTYQQSSRQTQQHIEIDPENRRLARGSRFRLPAWMLRDQALAVGGLLSATFGGPAINTYQPAGVWEEATFGKKSYTPGTGEELYRRSLLVFWRRIIAPTMFFDSASRQTCSVKVVRTNTPLHSLLTLNETTYVEAARHVAQRVLLAGEPSGHADVGVGQTDDAAADANRLQAIFQRIVARQPTDAEREILLNGLHRARQEFESHPQRGTALLAVGDSPRDPRLDVIEHASWTTVCLTVMNMDETLTRE